MFQERTTDELRTLFSRLSLADLTDEALELIRGTQYEQCLEVASTDQSLRRSKRVKPSNQVSNFFSDRGGQICIKLIAVPRGSEFRQQAHNVPGHGLPGAGVEPAHRDAANEVKYHSIEDVHTKGGNPTSRNIKEVAYI